MDTTSLKEEYKQGVYTMEEIRKLDEEELEMVAGGVGYKDVATDPNCDSDDDGVPYPYILI